METEEFELEERLQLALDRIAGIPGEDTVDEAYKDYFEKAADYIVNACKGCAGSEGNEESGDPKALRDLESLKKRNEELYSGLIHYETSYANPDYADAKLGIYGSILSFLAAELYGLGRLIADKRLFDIVTLLELFIEIYCLFCDEKKPYIKHIEEAVYYYAYDYIGYAADERLHDMLTPSCGIAYDIVMNADLKDPSYLYGYGEYVSDNELKLSAFLNELEEDEIRAMAATFTNGFRRGFETMHIEFEEKKTVEVRYFLGQERLVRETVRQFKELGLDTILTRGDTGRIIKNGLIKQGYNSISTFNQFEYDHKSDDALFLDKKFMERKLQAYEKAYKHYEDAAHDYAGPAVIECFGENEFSPVSKDTACSCTDEQSEMRVEISRRMGEIRNGYIPGDKYSFTIIAYPIPEIGENFEEIFRETVRINNLDNDTYTAIHQAIIDTMDAAAAVRIEGKKPNVTDMYVTMRKLENPEKESQFENCVADVNIPLGEVFTSPLLTGTHGVLNVSHVYINGLLYKDLKIKFEDGVVTDYTCSNFEEEEKNRKYIKDNILFDHDFLPIGEFAIGTNTEAFVMAEKYDILGKLPILIIEKTGPHFAVGDTCYRHAEDNPVYNPDGKEIVARENEFSALRNTEPEKAYFNCHTDITIPYSEIGRLYTVNRDDSETDIIVDGKFVLSGTEALNNAFS